VRTIRRQLLIGLLGATLLCVLGAGARCIGRCAWRTHELADLQLPPIGGRRKATACGRRSRRRIRAAKLGRQQWRASAARLAWEPLDNHAVRGFTTLKVDGHHWRLYGEQRWPVCRGEPLAAQQAAAEMACVPARRWCSRWCWALLVFVVGRALRPLDRLAQAVEGRSASALEPAVHARDLPSCSRWRWR
jgi:two-component system OmpR family sensor kinase